MIAFSKYENMTDALNSAMHLTEGKLPPQLKEFLDLNVKDKHVIGDIAIADGRLATSIQKKYHLNCIFNNSVLELMKVLKLELEKKVSAEDLKRMSIGLSHSLSRFKLKFSPEKIDVMIVQAVGLLDDIDKEINTYAMRARFAITSRDLSFPSLLRYS